MTLNLGIIGYGGMGYWHGLNAGNAEGVRVIAAYDIFPGQVEEAREAGLKGYYALDEFLSDKEINTVLIATPNHVHKELAIAAAKAGKHVICEKPVAMSVKELDEMVAAAEENNVLFTVHQNRRWDKDFCIAKKVFESGELGKIFTVESRLHGSGGLIHGWRSLKQYGGGMVFDWGVHFLDQLLQMIPGKIKSVYADLHSVINTEVDDYFKIILKFENGISVQTEVGTFCLRSLPRWFICGDKGSMTIEDFEGRGGITKVNKLAETVAPVIVQTSAGPTRTFAPQPPETRDNLELPPVGANWIDFYSNVAKAIEGKEELIVKPAEVRRVLSLIETVFRSYETGKTLEFE